MYFHESEAIAAENLDLHDTVEKIDRSLAAIFTSAPLRPTDFASNLGCDSNQVVAIFGLLAESEVLRSEQMVECERCHNLMAAEDFKQAIADEDDFECSGCGRPFRRRTPVITVYRMTEATLARPKPAVATEDAELALRELDQHPCVFRRIGQVWVLKYDGKMVLMKDAAGLSYLARLLLDPGRVFPAAFLLAAEAGIDPRITTGTSGRPLDDEAMTTYTQEYRELQEDLEEAEGRNDLGRVAQIKSKLEIFGTQIAEATGFGGRKREKTDAERVRKNVSMAVSRAIDSIHDEHLTLGKHLRRFVSSGLSFCYDPEKEPGWLI